MEVLFLLLFIIGLFLWTYYDPSIDVISSKGGTQIILLWYNKYQDNYVQRAFVKLWEKKNQLKK